METANLEQAQVSYNQGLAHLKSGNLDAVIECFREALLLNPNFAEVHNTIGIIQFQIEKYENAIQLFDNALAMNPNFAEAYNNRGLARSKICHKSEFPKVIEDYTKAIALNRKLVQAYLNRADTYKNLTGDNPAAILDYNQVILLDPNCLSAYINRANIYFLSGELEKSLFDLEKALSLARISHKLQAFDRAEGQKGKNQGTLKSPLLPCSPAPLLPCTSTGFERCGEKSGSRCCQEQKHTVDEGQSDSIWAILRALKKIYLKLLVCMRREGI